MKIFVIDCKYWIAFNEGLNGSKNNCSKLLCIGCFENGDENRNNFTTVMDTTALVHIGFDFGPSEPILHRFYIGFIITIFRFCIGDGYSSSSGSSSSSSSSRNSSSRAITEPKNNFNNYPLN